VAALTLREATASDNEALCDLLVKVGIASGTAFSLDRNPDFFALLRCRGESRTFVVETRERRVVGVVSVLWHLAHSGPGAVGEACRVGEIVDLRVAPECRYTRATFLLLEAACAALAEAQATWLTCLIGAKNHLAAALTHSGQRVPRLRPLTTYASVHYPTWQGFAKPHASVRALASEAAAATAAEATGGRDALVPVGLPLTFASERALGEIETRGWVIERGSRPLAGLVLSDLSAVRRVRVNRYAPSDWPLLGVTSVLAGLGRATALPGPGGALKIWATRCVWAENAQQLARLIRAAMRVAGEHGVHVLQVNVAESSPVAKLLPRGPRSTFYSTLFGERVVASADARRLRVAPAETAVSTVYFADVALA
jgi:hypothetical protein